MKIAISNLAWNADEEEAVFALLRDRGLSSVEIAPAKFCPDILAATKEDALAQRARCAAAGVSVVAFQSLLFGHPELVLFAEAKTREATLAYLNKLAELASWLGAGPLVFGSPKNRRRPEGLEPPAARKIASEFFRAWSQRCHELGAVAALEPNAPDYGCNFMVTAAETAAVVQDTASPACRLNLDAGVMTMNGEDPARTVAEVADLIGHVHVSEPRLAPVNGQNAARHRALAAALRKNGYAGFVSIEMLPPPDGLPGLARALDFVGEIYGG